MEREKSDVASRRTRFIALYDEHVRAVLLYCRRRADETVVDDVCSETFLVAWRRLEDVPDDARPWLLGVARRVMANQRRGDRRRAALHTRLTVSATTWTRPSDADREQPGQLGRSVRELLRAMPERDREALTLVHWEGLTPAQAARAMDCTAAAVRVRLHRARRRLARQLAQEDKARSAQPAWVENGGGS